MRMRHAEFGGALVHQRGEIVLGAGESLGQRDRRVVAGLDDEAAEQVLDAHLAVDVEEHRRPVRMGAAGAPGVFRHLKLVVEIQPAFLQFVKDDLGGQHLGGRRRRHRLVGVLFEQDRAALVVLDQSERRDGLKAIGCARPHAREREEKRGEGDSDQNEATARRIQFRSSTARPRICRARLFLHRHCDKSTTRRGFG